MLLLVQMICVVVMRIHLNQKHLVMLISQLVLGPVIWPEIVPAVTCPL